MNSQKYTTLGELVAAINKCKNEEDAFKLVKNTKDVPQQVADWFSDRYNPFQHRSQEQAFHLFYTDIKAGLI